MDAPEVTPPEHIPPKVVSREARRVTEDDSSRSLPATRAAGRLDRRMAAGEYPVLEAFQQFLEHERQRARRHMLILTGLCATGLLALIAIGAISGFAVYRDMGRNVAGVEDRIVAVETQARDLQAKALDAVTQAVDATEALRLDVDNRDASRAESVQAYEATLAAMRTQLGKMESQNAAVAGELDAVREVMPSLSADMGVLVDLVESLRAPPAPTITTPSVVMEPEPEAPADPVAASVPAKPPLTLRVNITPPGMEQAIPWLVLIPE